MEENWDKYDFVMQKVKTDGYLLRYASKDLRGNKEIVKEAVRQNVTAFRYASDDIQNNPELIQEILRDDVNVVTYLNEEMRQNSQIQNCIEQQILMCQLSEKIKKINMLIQQRQMEQEGTNEYEVIEKQLKFALCDIENIDVEDVEGNLEEKLKYYQDVWNTYKESNWKDAFRLGVLPNVEKVSIDDLENNQEAFENKNICLQVKDASELSIEKLEELEDKYNIVSVKFKDIDIDRTYGAYAYDTITYKRCREKIDQLIQGIDTKDGELEAFAEVIKRISYNIQYDYFLLDKELSGQLPENQAQGIKRHIRNLEGGLLNNACVCGGYCEIVRNILPCIGIEARYVDGPSKDEDEIGHAWNQVKIDGVWYNMDLTWDRDNIVQGNLPQYMLKSDNEFMHEQYDVYAIRPLEECKQSLPIEKLERCFCKQQKIQNTDTLDRQQLLGLRQNTVIQDIVRNVRQSDITKAQETLIATMEARNREKENGKFIDDER